MTYLVTANEIITITEVAGTVQNTSQIGKVELSDSNSFTNNIILYPLQNYTFDRKLYARLFDNGELPVELRVVPFQVNGGGGSGSGSSSGSGTVESGKVASDTEFNDLLDELFPVSGSDSINNSSGGGDNSDSPRNIATDDEFNSMLDDLGL